MKKLALLNTSILTTAGVYELTDISLEQARQMVADNADNLDSAVGHQATADIMTALLIKKTGMNMAYEMMRNEAVDFPVLSAAAAEDGAGNTRIAVGARPSRAGLVTWEGQLSALDAK